LATYAIGDVQGCYDELRQLLDRIAYEPGRDRLWLTGDLVNRGPRSAQVLRLVRALGESAVVVLGNHDLHLLALAEGDDEVRAEDNLADVLLAEDRDELLHWLRHRPLLHHDEALGLTLIHAGLPPQWGLDEARAHAAEVEQTLRGPAYEELFAHMYGDEPSCWSPELGDWDRLRFIVNCLTRLRYCDRAGHIALHEKGPPGSQPQGLLPWFAVPERRSRSMRVLFGHWSALSYHVGNGFFALDSGCIWGGRLTALRLDSLTASSIPCRGIAMVRAGQRGTAVRTR
jgi:bis(5'-nucleosyl)-tetraphosphatase (symmetrical)